MKYRTIKYIQYISKSLYNICVILCLVFIEACSYSNQNNKVEPTLPISINDTIQKPIALDTIYTEIPSQVEFNDYIFFGMSIDEWNKAIAERTSKKAYDRVEKEYNGSLKGVKTENNHTNIIKGIFQEPTQITDKTYQIFTKNNNPILQPFLTDVSISKDNLTSSEVSEEFEIKIKTLTHIAGTDFFLSILDRPSLYQSENMYISYITSNNYDEISKKEIFENGYFRKINKNEMEPFIRYISVITYNSKYFFPYNPEHFMTDSQIEENKKNIESEKLINDALKK